MASGTYNLSLEHSSSSVSFQGKLEWTSTSNGSSANSSNVVVKLYARKQGSSQATSGTFKGFITIDGTKTTFSQSKSVQNSWVLISTSSKTVSHNANGTKSITIAGEVGSVSGTTLANIKSTGSTSITLDTIPRYATIQNVSITDDESPIYIDINTPAYSSYTNLQVCVSKDNYTPIDNWKTIPISGTPVQMVSETYILNATELNSIYISNTTTNNATIYIIVRSTLNGTTQTSKVSKTLQIVNANPEFTSANMSYEDANASIVAITGDNQILVGTKSTFQINWTAPTLKKSATLSSIVFTETDFNYYTYTTSSSSGSYAWFPPDDDFVVNAVITDSRGNTCSASMNVHVAYWWIPIVSVQAKRQNNYEDLTYIIATASIKSVDGINSLQSLRYRYAENVEPYVWSAWTNLTNGVQSSLSINKDKEYIFTVEATDKFGSGYVSAVVSKGIFPFFIDIDKNSIGINCFPENNRTLEIDGDIHATGCLTLGNQSIITASSYQDVSLTGSTTTNIPLEGDNIIIGDKLSIDNGNIKVVGDTEYVLVSGKVQFNTLNSSAGLRYIQIYQNSTNIISTRVYVSSSNTGVSLIVPPQLVQVQNGDLIKLNVQGLSGDVFRGTRAWSYITVEALNYKEV